MQIPRVIVAALACVGVLCFVIGTRVGPRTFTSLQLANPATNFAYVRVAGVVSSYPLLDSSTGNATFVLRDETGDIRVTMAHMSGINGDADVHLPMPGDHVWVDGTVRVRDEQATIWVSNPSSISTAMSRTVSISTQIAAIDTFRPGDFVTFEGQIRSKRDVTNLRILSVRDGNSIVDVLIPTGLTGLFGKPFEPVIGDWILVSGAIGSFRDYRQVLTAAADDIRRLPVAKEWELRPLSIVTRSHIGNWIAVTGVVRDVHTKGPGTRIQIEDEHSKAFSITMFETWMQVPFSLTLRPGDVIAAQGQLVADRGGALELRPELAIDIALR